MCRSNFGMVHWPRWSTSHDTTTNTPPSFKCFALGLVLFGGCESLSNSIQKQQSGNPLTLCLVMRCNSTDNGMPRTWNATTTPTGTTTTCVHVLFKRVLPVDKGCFCPSKPIFVVPNRSGSIDIFKFNRYSRRVFTASKLVWKQLDRSF